ncbi:MAG TPA: protein kinase, partial [Ktedonobacteraceae bacterium]|nr:protein kinase [Ktedonobacteraceae bacterium]
QEDFAYLVMPFLTRGSLKERLVSGPALLLEEALRLIEQVLLALHYAHEQGLVHRDIKPANLLFKTDDSLLLSDFGLVKILARESDLLSPLTTTGAASKLSPHSTLAYAGTPHYMAPEQIEGRATPQSDLYSTGVVLYELLTGSRPFDAENLMGLYLKHLTEQPRAPRELNPQISPELEAVVLRALAKDPTQRFQSASDFLQALRAIPIDTHSANVLPAPVVRIQAKPQQPIDQNTYTTKHISRLSPTLRKTPGRAILLLLLAIMVVSASTVALAYAISHLHAPQPAQVGTHSSATSSAMSTPMATPTSAQPAPSATAPPLSGPVPLSALHTECPQPGTARPAALNVRPVLTRESRQNLVYQTDVGLERYDIATGQRISILLLANTTFSFLQISADGQWIFFVTKDADGYKIQLVRVDGKARQTLYCSSDVINTMLWSPHQDRVIFNIIRNTGNATDSQATLYLLNTVTGQLRLLMKTMLDGAFRPLMWSARQHNLLYLTNFRTRELQSKPYPGDLYILNTDSQQPPAVVFREVIGCPDYTLSPDDSRLFISDCGSLVPPGGKRPGGIQVASNPTNASSLQTIYSGSLAIAHMAMISNGSLLLEMENNEGLWKINTDGSGLTQLTSSGQLMFNNDLLGGASYLHNNQDIWANISRDGKWYSVFLQNTIAGELAYGLLSGGALKTLAVRGRIIGWTTL